MIDDNAKKAMVATRSFHLHGEPHDYESFLKKVDAMNTVELDAELRSLGLEPEAAVAVVKKAISDAIADLAIEMAQDLCCNPGVDGCSDKHPGCKS